MKCCKCAVKRNVASLMFHDLKKTGTSRCVWIITTRYKLNFAGTKLPKSDYPENIPPIGIDYHACKTLDSEGTSCDFFTIYRGCIMQNSSIQLTAIGVAKSRI